MLDFRCPICGGQVTADISDGRDWATLDFKCRRCGLWCDVDITPYAEEARDEAMAYFEDNVDRIEGDEP